MENILVFALHCSRLNNDLMIIYFDPQRGASK